MSRARTHVNVGITAAAILLAVSWAVSAAPLQSAPTASPTRTIDAARFATIDGAVQVKQAGSREWVAATRAAELRADDLVRTGPGGNAEIRFADGTLFKLRPDSLIQIEETAPKPAVYAARLHPVPVAVQPGEDTAAAGVPKLVHKVNPVYPEAAKADKAEGMFQLAIVVGKDGAVRDAKRRGVVLHPGTARRRHGAQWRPAPGQGRARGRAGLALRADPQERPARRGEDDDHDQLQAELGRRRARRRRNSVRTESAGRLGMRSTASAAPSRADAANSRKTIAMKASGTEKK